MTQFVTMGIDQSFTSTGICIDLVNRDPNLFGARYYLKVIRTEKDATDPLSSFKRAMEVAENIAYLCKDFKVEKVNLEGLGFGAKGNATRDLSGLQYLIVSKLIELGFSADDINIIAPTSLKKFATGNGKAKKEDMFDALPEGISSEIGRQPKTKGRYDLTDAYYLATWK